MKNTIKIERARHNLTQAQLAEKVKVSRQTINAMELGKYVPSTVLVVKVLTSATFIRADQCVMDKIQVYKQGLKLKVENASKNLKP